MKTRAWKRDRDPRETQPFHLIRPPCVLLAEDNVALRSLIASALRDDGYDVMEAADGRQLLRRIETAWSGDLLEDQIALVISDVHMPGWTGLEILAGLREGDSAVPVVLITAFGSPETHAAARSLGAAATFDKPFDLDDLRASVREIVPRS